MTIWKLSNTGGTVEQTPQELGVESLVIRYLNKAPDECNIMLALDPGEALPPLLAAGETVDIWADDLRVFRGEVENPTSSTQARNKGRSVKLYGLWRVFEQTPWVTTDANGIVRSTGSISGSATAALETLLASCEPEINAGRVDLGTDFELPGNFKVNHQTVAEVIRNITKMIPGLICYFDCNKLQARILTYDSIHMQEVSLPDELGSLQWNEEVNSCTAVNIYYDRETVNTVSGESRETTYTRESQDCYPSEQHGRRTFTKTVTLEGSIRETIAETTITTAPDTQSAYDYMYDNSLIMDTLHGDNDRFTKNWSADELWARRYSDYISNKQIIKQWLTYQPTTDYKDFAIIGAGPLPMQFYANGPDQDLPYIVVIDVYFTLHHDNGATQNCSLSFIAYRVGDSMPGASEYVRKVLESDSDDYLEPAPSPGAAETIYGVLNSNIIKGSATVPGFLTHRARRLAISRSDELVATTPIQDLTYTYERDETRISFGSPRHLTADEIIDVRRTLTQ